MRSVTSDSFSGEWLHKPRSSVAFFGPKWSGKSALVGQLLRQCGCVDESIMVPCHPEDQEAPHDAEALRHAWLLDGPTERDPNLSRPPHYAVLERPDRLLTLVDLPAAGKNSCCGIAGVEVGVLVVDAQHELRDLKLVTAELIMAYTAGVKQLCVAVTRIEALEFNQTGFEQISAELNPKLRKVGFKPDKVPVVPVSGALGINVVLNAGAIPWYTGLSLLDALQSPLRGSFDSSSRPLRVCIKHVFDRAAPHSEGGVGFGVVLSGVLRPGMSCSVSPGAVSAKVHQVRFMGAKQLGPTWMRMWRLVAQGRAECTDPFLARLFDTDTVSCHLFELVISKARSVDDYAGMPGDHVTFSFSGPRRQEVQRGHVLSECTREPARGCVSFVAQVIVLESEAGIKQGFEGVVYCHTASVNCKVRRILGSFDKRTGREIEESPRVLRRGQVGLVELAPCNCWPKDRRAGLAASDRQEFCVEPIKEVPGMGRFMMQNHGTKIVGAIRAVHKFASRADELEDSVALSLLKGKASQRMHSWEPEMLFALLRLRSCRPGRYRSPLPSSSLREVCRSAAVTPALRQQLLGFVFALEGVQVFREALPCLPVDDEMSGWLLTAESGLAQLGYTRGHIPPVVVMAALRDPAGLVRLIAAGPDTEALPQALQVADTHFQYKKQHGDYFAMNYCPRALTAPERCQIAVCQETIACLELASSGWSPESHHLFPSRFREVVRSVVGSYKLMARAFARQGGLHVSTQLTEMILQHLPRDHGFDYDGIRSKKHIGLWK